MVFGFNTIGKTIKRLEAEQAAVQAELPGMSATEQAIATLGSTAVHREFLLEILRATRKSGGSVGWINSGRPNALSPIEPWTESQQQGFAKCLAATAFLFPDGPVRSSYFE